VLARQAARRPGENGWVTIPDHEFASVTCDDTVPSINATTCKMVDNMIDLSIVQNS
jgi:hypothetical protein